MALCCTELGTIAKFCGGVNAPGLDRQLGIACGDHVIGIQSAVGHRITEPITMRPAVPANTTTIPNTPATPAGLFYAWNFSKEDQEFTSEQDENGLWKTQVKIFMPKMESSKSFILNNSTGDDKIVVLKDRNGKQRLIGSTTEGCSVKVKEQATPRNGYVVEIMWESAHSPYFYESTITF